MAKPQVPPPNKESVFDDAAKVDPNSVPVEELTVDRLGGWTARYIVIKAKIDGRVVEILRLPEVSSNAVTITAHGIRAAMATGDKV